MTLQTTWKLADAKNRFSELVNYALALGPQFVERRGERIVVLSGKEYDRLTGKKPGFKTMLTEGPTLENLNLTRAKDTMRDVSL